MSKKRKGSPSLSKQAIPDKKPHPNPLLGKEREKTAANGRLHLLGIGAALVVLVWAVFWRVHGYDFVDWDDSPNIPENPLYRPLATSHFGQMWSTPYFAAYIPITRMLWAFLAGTTTSPTGSQIAVFDPHVYHTANLVVHSLNVLLVFLVLRLLLRAAGPSAPVDIDELRLDIAAGFGAAIFAVHPLQVEPVAWVTGMKDLLCAFFSLIALYLYLLQRDRTDPKSRVLLILSTAAYVLATLSKSSAVALPFIMLFLEWALKDKTETPGVPRDRALALGLWLGVAVAIAIVTKHAEDLTGIQAPAVPIWQRPFVMGDTLTFYLEKTVIPLRLGPDYGRSPSWLMQHGAAYAMILVPIAFAALCIIARVQSKWPLAAYGIWFLSILPVSGLTPFSFQFLSTTADRYMYFAMLGIALAAAGGLASIPVRKAAVAGVIVVGALVALTSRQVAVWQNSESLFTQGLLVNPTSSVSHTAVGHQLDAAGDVDGAIAEFRAAVQCNPAYADAHNALGATLGEKWSKSGLPAATSPLIAEAQSELEQAVALNEKFAEGHSNLGNVYMIQGRYADALKQFQTSLKLLPNDPNVTFMIGLSLAKLGKLDQSQTYLHQSAAEGYKPAIQALKNQQPHAMPR